MVPLAAVLDLFLEREDEITNCQHRWIIRKIYRIRRKILRLRTTAGVDSLF
jgi:hypothetical protein